MVDRPIPAEWLTLRRDADHRAREATRGLVDRVAAHLQDRLGPSDTAVVIDVGAGTGSNQRWLAPRLDVRQTWILVDHDASLVQAADHADLPHVVATTHRVATVAELPALVPDGPGLITCAALLDLLTQHEIDALADVIAPAGGAGTAALLSLSVTGRVTLSPGDPFDERVSAAFDAHQRRDGILGPDAAEHTAAELRRRGAEVEVVATDWVLDASHAPLVRRYLADRVAAAVEDDPSLAEEGAAWLRRRDAQLAGGGLEVRVGHLDILSLPARP